MKSKTMVYLEPEQLQALRQEAGRRGISLAELLRRVVARYLEGRDRRPRVSRKTYLKIVALGSSGHSHVSEQHDRLLACFPSSPSLKI